MKIKTNLSIIAIIIMLTSMFLLPNTTIAQTTYTNLQDGGSIPLPAGVTANHVEDTRAFLSFSPTTLGVGQTLLVNVWLNPALHVSRYFRDYTITITKPDGTTEVFKKDSYRADTTSWLEYKPDQVGSWKVKFVFPGGYFPAGNYTVYSGAFIGAQVWNFSESTYYQPSQTHEQTFTVQQDMIPSWPPAALPTDYWTRPVSLENREWWPILGNYPGTGYIGGGSMWDQLYPDTNPYWNPTGDFHPWVVGPNSAHVVWKRQNAIAGLLGGPAGQYGLAGNPGNPTLVFMGRCYQTVTLQGGTSVAQCYDLRTGEIYYEIPTASGGVTPSYIAYIDPGAGSVPGSEAQSTYSVELLSISGTRLYKVNPWTGVATNISISTTPSLSSTVYYMNQYVLSLQDLGGAAGANRYRLINWTTSGTSNTFADRIISNTTYARSSFTSSNYPPLQDAIYAFNTALIMDFNSGYGATVGSVQDNNSTGIYEQMRIQSYKISTGQAVWDLLIDEPQYSRSCYIADHGTIAVLTQKGYFLAYDLATGKLVWQSEQMTYPWGAPSFGAYALQSAYGLLYRQSYDGIYAFNWTNGKIVWRYTSPAFAAFESPYLDSENGTAVYPFNTGATIADGKMFTYNTEHTASWPRTRGWSLHCINATTGEGIWQMSGEMSPGAISDGYLTAANSWDGYMYVFGKGKTQTTLETPLIAASKGQSIVLQGTILDMSPAQPGTPCVAKESMTTQMEYLHEQQPIAGLWNNETIKGVPVSLDTIDPNGNSIHIATVNSEGYSGTYAYTWTPEIPGQYQITATFIGDESYGSSFATAYTSVTDNTQTIATPSNTETVVSNPPYELYIIGMGIAIIVTVLSIGFLLYRKRA
jgi:hypothetical protein